VDPPSFLLLHIIYMEIEFDDQKDLINRKKHGISLAAAAEMEFDAAVIRKDDRYDYGETRWLAAGPIGGRLHMLVFTIRGGTIRAISLRKANLRERRSHGES
jgi:uncharacterized protein